MTDLLRTTAKSNGGYFTTQQAYDCGYSTRDLRRAVNANVIRRFRRGAYAFADIWDPLDLEARHVIVLRAVVAGMPGPVVACGASACALQGLSLWKHDLTKVHVARLDNGAGRREAGVVHHHGAVNENEIQTIDGVPSVPIDQAMCQAATAVSLESGIVLFDSALRLKTVSEDQLSKRATDMVRCPDSRKVRFGVAFADGRSQSPGESRTRYLYYRFDLPTPDLQVPIHASDGRLIGITDFGWELYCHVGEFDGMIKYRRDFRAGMDPEQVVVDEKLREDEIRAERKGVTRTIWRELDDRLAERTADRTRADLERSRQLYTRNRVTIT